MEPPGDGWRPPSDRRPQGERGSRALLVGLVVVVAAIVVLALLLAGVIPGLYPPAPTGPSSGFAGARSQAQAAADGYPGGDWSLISASGIVPISALSYPLNGTQFSGLANGSGCSYSALAGGTESLAGSANVSQGNAAAWFFVFRNTSDGALLVSDTSESVTLVGAVSGSCVALLGYLNPIPTTIIDATVAAQAADNGGGYAFLRAHPFANATLSVLGGATIFGASSPAYWTVSYSDCPLDATTATTAAAFAANVSAVSGDLLTTRTFVAACPVLGGGGSGPRILGDNFALRPVTSMPQGGVFTYTVGVLEATAPLAADDLTVTVQTSTGQVVQLASGTDLNLTATGGSVLASFSLTGGVWVSGGSVAISTSDTFTLVTSTDLDDQGYVLFFAGESPYQGSVVAGIP